MHFRRQVMFSGSKNMICDQIIVIGLAMHWYLLVKQVQAWSELSYWLYAKLRLIVSSVYHRRVRYTKGIRKQKTYE